jgi:hypothetical protein
VVGRVPHAALFRPHQYTSFRRRQAIITRKVFLGRNPIVLPSGSSTLLLMSSLTTKLALVGFIASFGFLAGCAWDNSPPPYRSVITFDPSRAHTFLSDVPPANAPSTRDWKTNQIVGVGYGSTGPNTPATSGQAAGGAASTPSGVSYGGAGGTTTGPTTSPGSGTPGTIVGNPPGTGIGTYPTPAPTATPGPLRTSPAISPPPPATGLNSTTPFSSPSSPSPGFSSPGITNSGSGALFTNRFTAPTNSFSSPGLNVPKP